MTTLLLAAVIALGLGAIVLGIRLLQISGRNRT